MTVDDVFRTALGGNVCSRDVGMGGEGATSSALTELVEAASSYRWAAASIGSQTAASLELSSGASVMAIGGFTGSDDAPSLAQFQAWVAAGDIHYFIASQGGPGGGGGPGGQNGVGTQISTWVAAHFTSTTVGGSTVYDLTAPTS